MLAQPDRATAPRQPDEPSPLRSSDGAVVLVYDGRIDNREELLPRLRAEHGLDESLSDGMLLLRAYERWGDEFLVDFAGDFAVVLWDARRRALVFARDQLGQRPLFYAFTPRGGLVVASEAEMVLHRTGRPAELDGEFLTDWLSGRDPSPEATQFRHVRALPPAGIGVYDASGLRTRSYWDLRGVRPLRYRRTSDYADHFNAVFDRVLRSKTQSSGTLGVTLSGGLDSSAVSASACRVSELRGYMYYDPEHAEMDERPYARAAAEALGIPLCEIPLDGDLSPLPPFATTDPCTPPQWPAWERLLDRAAADGVRVLLTGDGGDEVCGGDIAYLARLAARLRLRSLWRELQDWNREVNASRARLIRHHTLLPLLPGPIGRRLNRDACTSPPWLVMPAVATDNGGSGLAGLRPPACAPQSFGAYGHPVAGPAAWVARHLATARGIELRHPFWDVRLVQLAAAIPDEVKLRPGRNKVILRESLTGRLPAAVAERRTKPSWTPVQQAWLTGPGRERVADLLDHPRLAAEGYVVPRVLQDGWNRYLAGQPGCSHVLWRALAAEHWLRQRLEDNRPSAVDIRPPSVA